MNEAVESARARKHEKWATGERENRSRESGAPWRLLPRLILCKLALVDVIDAACPIGIKGVFCSVSIDSCPSVLRREDAGWQRRLSTTRVATADRRAKLLSLGRARRAVMCGWTSEEKLEKTEHVEQKRKGAEHERRDGGDDKWSGIAMCVRSTTRRISVQ